MDSVRDTIVTLSTLRPSARAQSEAADEQDALTPEDELRMARYQQIMARLQQETEKAGADVMVTVQDREVSLAQSKVAEDAETATPLAAGGQEIQFGEGFSGHDWFRWIWSLTDWVDHTEAAPIKRPSSAKAETVPPDLRVAMASDWGTGLYGAPKIAHSMRAMAAGRKFDLLMHLGDVYYSGTPKEVQDRFLSVWPTDAGATNRALNGNHEMYSGGFGYFRDLLPAFKQDSSYFAVQNDDWLLVGLDTAYVDHDIDNAQVAWLTLLVQQSMSPKPRRVVLFSHQQPFSRLDSQGPKLQKALKTILESGVIAAWYWGHEHQCVLYDPHPRWGFLGRCLGNGGIPAARKPEVTKAAIDPGFPGAESCTWRRFDATADSPGCLVLDGPNADMAKSSDQQKYAPHGFMTLEFNGPQLIERVHHSHQTVLFTNAIT